MKVSIRPSRQSCGHYCDDALLCDECESFGSTPDPWEVAGDDVDLNRLAETRSYRQSKSRR